MMAAAIINPCRRDRPGLVNREALRLVLSWSTHSLFAFTIVLVSIVVHLDYITLYFNANTKTK